MVDCSWLKPRWGSSDGRIILEPSFAGSLMVLIETVVKDAMIAHQSEVSGLLADFESVIRRYLCGTKLMRKFGLKK